MESIEMFLFSAKQAQGSHSFQPFKRGNRQKLLELLLLLLFHNIERKGKFAKMLCIFGKFSPVTSEEDCDEVVSRDKYMEITRTEVNQEIMRNQN